MFFKKIFSMHLRQNESYVEWKGALRMVVKQNGEDLGSTLYFDPEIRPTKSS